MRDALKIRREALQIKFDPINILRERDLTDISPADITVLENQSLSFHGPHDSQSLQFSGAVGLGLGGRTSGIVFTAYVRAHGITHWQTVYKRLFDDPNTPQTEKFMQYITSTFERIIFCLPSHIFSFTTSCGNYIELEISKELRWLLRQENQHYLSKTYFIVGLYDAISLSSTLRLQLYPSLAYEDRPHKIRVLARAFKC